MEVVVVVPTVILSCAVNNYSAAISVRVRNYVVGLDDDLTATKA